MFAAVSIASGVQATRSVTCMATHPRFKGAKKMAHKRPKKHGSDRRRGAAVYPPPPPPPAEYTVLN